MAVLSTPQSFIRGSNMTDSSIIERARKLLALSQSSNEHEAMSALEKLHALMARHNLTLADLKQRPEDFVLFHTEPAMVSEWERIVWQAGARLNYCTCAYTISEADGSTIMLLYGHTLNVQVSTLAAAYLKQAIDRAVQSIKAAQPDLSANYEKAFRHAAAVRLDQRVILLLAEAEKKGVDGGDGSRLPVPIGLGKQVQAAFDERFKPQIRESMVEVDEEGAVAGFRAADAIGLDRQVKQSTHKALKE